VRTCKKNDRYRSLADTCELMMQSARPAKGRFSKELYEELKKAIENARAN
jgi:hypothetical protein